MTEVKKNNTTIIDESAKNQDFFQDNNAIKKKENVKPYTTTQIKSRNFLSNISYVGVNKEDFYNKGFIFYVYSLVVKNINPFSLERKKWSKQARNHLHALEGMCPSRIL